MANSDPFFDPVPGSPGSHPGRGCRLLSGRAFGLHTLPLDRNVRVPALGGKEACVPSRRSGRLNGRTSVAELGLRAVIPFLSPPLFRQPVFTLGQDSCAQVSCCEKFQAENQPPTSTFSLFGVARRALRSWSVTMLLLAAQFGRAGKVASGDGESR